MNPTNSAFRRFALVPLLCAGALAACSSGPPPNAALAASAAALESARSAGAPEFAAAELNDARAKLERARALAQAGRNREAIRMAEQADADSQLARAKAGSERSKRAVSEVEASLAALRDELNRLPPTGAGPAGTAPQQPPQALPSPGANPAGAGTMPVQPGTRPPMPMPDPQPPRVPQ